MRSITQKQKNKIKYDCAGICPIRMPKLQQYFWLPLDIYLCNKSRKADATYKGGMVKQCVPPTGHNFIIMSYWKSETSSVFVFDSSSELQLMS